MTSLLAFGNEHKDDASAPAAAAALPAAPGQPFAVEWAAMTAECGLLTVSTGAPPSRCPVNIAFVLDVSGSMETNIALDGEQTNLTALEVAKHALKTAAHVLGPDDTMTIITFSDNARFVGGGAMSDANTAECVSKINAIQAGGCTNLWAGLQMGLSHVSTDLPKQSAVFVLTDGFPNRSPPRGEVDSLKRLFTTLGHRVPVFTFGLGSNIDSQLLDNIAKESGGTFGYVPDANFVGTIFVHALVNLLITSATEVSVDIADSAKRQRTAENTAGKLVRHNQPARFVLPLGTQQVVVRGLLHQKPVSQTVDICLTEQAADPHYAVLQEVAGTIDGFLLHAVSSSAYSSYGSLSSTSWTGAEIGRVISLIGKCDPSTSALGTALLKDLQGEISLAVKSKENWNKWGMHFLRSLMGCYRHGYCNNFKDHVPNFFGTGDVFEALRDTADDVFNKLPPPEPPVSSEGTIIGGGYHFRGFGGGGGAPVAQRRVTSMAQVNNSSAPCYLDGLVDTTEGTKMLSELVPDKDTVLGIDGVPVEVLVVIRYQCTTNQTMYNIGDLVVTEHHPVFLDGKWKHPKHCGKPAIVQKPLLFNVQLAKGASSLVVGGVPVISIGHEIWGDPVAEHHLYGNHALVSTWVQSLKRAASAPLGHVHAAMSMADAYNKKRNKKRQIDHHMLELPHTLQRGENPNAPYY